MHRRQELHKPYFISDELKKMLSLIPAYPLTLIEAPSGFGKTTAVKEFLKDIHAVHYWYTCIGKPAFYTWRAIASLILQSDSESAANPIKTAFDNEAVLLSVSNLIQNIRCENDTYLVIDNYHLSGFEAGYDVINLLSMHGNPRLHFIFITQQPVTGKHEFFHNPNIHKIEGSSFLISREGTLLLFKNHGIKLSTEELDKVCKYTEGWAAAIQFQITNYKSLGSLHQSTDIELVFESTVWNKLDNEAREFLLCISVFSSFSLGQAVYMSGKESLNEKQLHLLKHWIFIKYAPDEDVFTLHSVLQSFLKTQLNALYSTEARNLLFKKAGRACQAEGKLYQAAQFYYSIKDYEAILSLPFNIQLFANQKDTLLLALLEKVVNHCPTEIMRLYPYSLIILAYPFVYEQKLETAAKITNIVSYALDQNLLNLEAGELNNLKGEFLLMKSNVTYANVRLMHESRKEAYALFQGESRTITKDIPWTIGSASPLFQFWSERGKLQQMLDDLDLSLPPYIKLTGGHCAGLSSLTRAEAALMSGNDNKAESLTFKAIYEAAEYNQLSLCLATEFVTARIAVLRGNIDNYLQAVENIKKYADESRVDYIKKMAELALTSLHLLLGITHNIPKWLCSLSSINSMLYAPSIPYAQTLYKTLLLYENRFNEFTGIADIISDIAERFDSLMAKAYHLCQCCYVNYKLGKIPAAKIFLLQALHLTFPDRVYLPVARFLPHIAPIFDSVKDEISDKDGLRSVAALSKRLEKGIDKIKKTLIQSKSPLTPREREVALYAKQRFSAKDIAKILYISDSTVRTILRNVYSKLGIHHKSELYNMDL